MNKPVPEAEGLGTRTFNGPFSIVWALFLFALFGFVGMPLRNALLVCWVRGADAFLHQGIRVLKGRPLAFSDGMAVPTLPATVTFIGVFITMAFGLSFLLLFGLRFYERHFNTRSANAYLSCWRGCRASVPVSIQARLARHHSPRALAAQ